MWELLDPVIPGIDRIVFPYVIRIVIFYSLGGIIGFWPLSVGSPTKQVEKGSNRASNRQTQGILFYGFGQSYLYVLFWLWDYLGLCEEHEVD